MFLRGINTDAVGNSELHLLVLLVIIIAGIAVLPFTVRLLQRFEFIMSRKA